MAQENNNNAGCKKYIKPGLEIVTGICMSLYLILDSCVGEDDYSAKIAQTVTSFFGCILGVLYKSNIIIDNDPEDRHIPYNCIETTAVVISGVLDFSYTCLNTFGDKTSLFKKIVGIAASGSTLITTGFWANHYFKEHNDQVQQEHNNPLNRSLARSV